MHYVILFALGVAFAVGAAFAFRNVRKKAAQAAVGAVNSAEAAVKAKVDGALTPAADKAPAPGTQKP